ncbi:DUF2225 domain-containing protein [Desnuesiella massiliensis]|uniref:DUF2225 domain-containing protein n=1 Tax=Desnuesiella massiliensis TaxID=1650662 RepID=UPI000A438CA4|nr:DUF2225 domain-containing protein [Desnuesiella massiliensis]
MADSQKNNTDIFSGLEHLGFHDVEDIKIFKKDEQEKMLKDTKVIDEDEKILSMLYDREITCPVCQSRFKARSVKNSAARVMKKDSDFFIRYSQINPYFYDVWLCNICGYASMKIDFERVKGYQIDLIQKNISIKWKGKVYPQIYDCGIAIERYKLALLNYVVMESKASSKAMVCLKIAWLYRLLEDYSSETTFLRQALEGFSEAYYSEDFPIYGMNRFTTMYLIGELNRRVENYEQALLWFSKVITTPSVPQKLKELARDQKDLIKTSIDANKEEEESEEDDEPKKKKRNLFLSFFK